VLENICDKNDNFIYNGNYLTFLYYNNWQTICKSILIIYSFL